jgi:hypothetical protein
MAEGMFKLWGIEDEWFNLFNCLHAIPEATVVLIADCTFPSGPLHGAPWRPFWLHTS